MNEWVRREGEHPGWFLPGYDADPGWGVTDYAIWTFGRQHIEKLLGSLPPLPGIAWEADCHLPADDGQVRAHEESVATRPASGGESLVRVQACAPEGDADVS